MESIDWNDPSLLPQPLLEGCVPNPEFVKLMAESRERLENEQKGMADFLKIVAELPLPTPIEKLREMKKKNN